MRLKCGRRGQHDDVLRDCVRALRDSIADLEFAKRKSPPTPPVSRTRRDSPRLPVAPARPISGGGRRVFMAQAMAAIVTGSK